MMSQRTRFPSVCFRLIILFLPVFTSCQKSETAKSYGLELISQSSEGTFYRDKRTGARIFVPADCHLTAPVPNRQVKYDFGIQHNTAGYEARVRFDRPLGPTPEQLKDCARRNKTAPGSCDIISSNGDKPGTSWALTLIANLMGGGIPDNPGFFELAAFLPQNIVQASHGDWGVYSRQPFRLGDPDFAGRYAGGMLWQVHKNGVGTYTLVDVFTSLNVKEHLPLSKTIRFKD